MLKIFIRILFFLPAETAHHFTLSLLKFSFYFPFVRIITEALFCSKNPKLKRTAFGIDFPNPVGLAAGFDKDAKYIDILPSLGFGFIEIGTVTPKPQIGNPKPRLFRLIKDKAIINRMGFNNDGVDAAVSRLKARKRKNVIIGGNIGKNKVTPNEQAVNDYEICFTKLFDYVDYFVVNVSSPNTPGLRELQEKDALSKILNHLQSLNSKKESPKPILLKIAPDLTDTQLDDIVSIVEETKIAGLITNNTTIDRSGLKSSQEKIKSIGNGGLSGLPLKNRSMEVLSYINTKSKGSIDIINVGGIMDAETGKERLDNGASLIQLYTGFIYNGPGIIKRINKLINR